MSNILTDLSTPALVDAIRQSLYDFCWELRDHWKQAVFYEDMKLRRLWSLMPLASIFNAVFSLQPPDGDEAALIGETVAYFQSRERNQFDWWLFPGLEASGWGRQLEANGLKFEEGEPGMAVDLSALPEDIPSPAELKIERLEDAERMKTWAKTFILGLQIPPAGQADVMDWVSAMWNTPMTSYLATIGDQPVAVSTLYFDAGVAGIYNVATVPEWRGKGIGAAVTLRPLLEARQQGYKAGILQSSDMGYRVYQRLGFKELCKMNHYHWQVGA